MKNKFYVAIVEDDPTIVDQLSTFLALTNLFETPFICENGMQALMLLRTQPVDLIFLDMELPDMQGLDLLKLFPNHAPVIVMSAHPKYAVDCYDTNVRDFLPKPLTYTRFLRGLHRTIFQEVTAKPEALTTESLVQLPTLTQPSVHKSAPSSTYIYLKTGRKTERFTYGDILYFEAFALYSKIVSRGGTFVVNEHLGGLDQQLNPTQFMRVHKSYLVNLSQITQFNANMLWINTHKIPIGVTFKGKVQECLKGFSFAGVMS